MTWVLLPLLPSVKPDDKPEHCDEGSVTHTVEATIGTNPSCLVRVQIIEPECDGFL